MPALLELTIGGQPSRWESLGLIDSQHTIAGVGLTFRDSVTGVASWTLTSSSDDRFSIDGIDTFLAPAAERHSTDTSPFCGANAVAIDHVVVNTDDLDRTSAALEARIGAERRRVRDAGHGVMQAFHVLDNTVIEIVSGPHIAQRGASLWGFVVVVDDIDAVITTLGDAMTPKKAAVQSGRFISSFRREAGLGVPVAVMTPR